MKLYFVLVHTPYPDDGVPSSREEPVQCRVQLERVHPISVVLLNLISNDIRHLKHKEVSMHSQPLCYLPYLCFTPTSCCFNTINDQCLRHYDMKSHVFDIRWLFPARDYISAIKLQFLMWNLYYCIIHKTLPDSDRVMLCLTELKPESKENY